MLTLRLAVLVFVLCPFLATGKHLVRCKDPKLCEKRYRPVCGTDGETYGNECILNYYSCMKQGNHQTRTPIKKKHDGKCKEQAHKPMCGMPYCPIKKGDVEVCASNGLTYANKCLVSSNNCNFEYDFVRVQYVRDGSCQGDCPTPSCKVFYDPVCGSDGKTYDNYCALAKAAAKKNCKQDKYSGLYKKKQGPCGPKRCAKPYCSPDSRNSGPICGEDGNTYKSRCALIVKNVGGCYYPGERPKQVKEAYEGECKDDQNCPEICPLGGPGVCASNGKTYLNGCLLSAASCQSVKDGGKPFTKVADGPCQSSNPCDSKKCKPGYVCVVKKPPCDRDLCLTLTQCVRQPKICVDPRCDEASKETGPVCGTNGKTYENLCRLILANGGCFYVNDRPNIKKAYDGPCNGGNECQCNCPEYYQPVCGSDNVTYDNKCFLKCASCKSQKAGNGKIWKKNDGKCKSTEKCRCGCPKIYKPVCGSDNVTYGNKCLLKCASCKSQKAGNGKIWKKKNGECKSKPNCAVRCADIEEPVCGSNCKTYQSSCFLAGDICQGVDVYQIGEGTCEDLEYFSDPGDDGWVGNFLSSNNLDADDLNL